MNKNWLRDLVIGKLLTSKKIWLGISAMVVPYIARKMQVDEVHVQELWYSLLAMLAGVSLADFGKESKK